MKYKALIFGICMALAGCATSRYDHRGSPISNIESEKMEAIARPWLKFIDDGKYGEAFDQYTERGKKRAGSKEKSVEFHVGRRAPFGSLIKRDLFRRTYFYAYNGLPDGNYIELVYISKFENKNVAIEYVILEKIGDQWRITGYAFK